MKKYYALTTGETSADLVIYGDIVTEQWYKEDASSWNIIKELEALPETVSQINVYINSYGGEVAAGLAIYNALRRHKAKVTTYCDGFACSAASIVFMSGDERVMGEASLLMIHNAWTIAIGNADGLRKTADDIEKISDVAANTYRAGIKITDEKLNALLEAESWITPAEALEWGFATSVVAAQVPVAASMSARELVYKMMLSAKTTQQEPEASSSLENGEFFLAIIADAVKEGVTAALNAAEPKEQTKKFFNFGGTK